jgi:DNA-binding NarL/FixJ family response regulator
VSTRDVLLLDDHRVFTDLMAIALDAQPDLRCVAVAHSVAEGLARAAETSFDVALVDIQLPDGGVLDALPELRTARPEARFVVLTAHPRPDLARRASAAGASGFLGKDAPFASILDAVRDTGVHDTAPADAPVPSDDAAARLGLTSRELDVLHELAQGRDARGAASALGISIHTTRDHIKSLRAKFGVHTQLDAVVSAGRLGLVTLGF